MTIHQMTYREAKARLDAVSATLVGDEAASDAQYYDALAAEQIALMNRLVELLAATLEDHAARSAHHFTLSHESALDLARDALVRQNVIW